VNFIEISPIPLSTDCFYVYDAQTDSVLFEGTMDACETFLRELFGAF
jgi:hypothetical protein